MSYRNRIVELVRVPASELIPSDENYRGHADAQVGSMLSVLDAIGFVGYILARRNDEGRLVILDGHMRAELAGDAVVPVLVLDVTVQEGRLILATHDKIAEFSEVDRLLLDTIINEVRGDFETLDGLFDTIKSSGVLPIKGSGEKQESDEKVVFQPWRLPISPQAAAILETKIIAYHAREKSLIGLADKILEATDGL